MVNLKRLLIVLFCSGLLTACTSFGKKPSICETNTAPSFLCAVAAEHGVTLEEVGAVLIAANSVAIGEGAYSAEDAVEVLTDLQDLLKNPVSYLFFRSRVKKAVDKYPALFTIADQYLNAVASPRIMHNFDRAILRSWLNARIRELKPHYGLSGPAEGMTR